MKFDMCGCRGAALALLAVSRMKLPLNLTVIVPAVENMPGGGASRPGTSSPRCPARPSKFSTPTPRAA